MGTRIRTLSPLWRFRQGPPISPNRLVSQSATLKELSVQGCKRAKHKTYIPLDHRWVILATWKAFHYFTFSSYLDLLLSSGRYCQHQTSIYDKRDDFNFHSTNFPFLGRNFSSSPAYGVCISQLIRYTRACSSYDFF